MFKKVLAAAMAGIVAVTLAVSAMAADRTVLVFNESRNTMIEFRASNAGQKRFGPDILPEYIGPGGSVWIDFNDRTGYCKFDFRATFTDGRRVWDVDKYGVNVCEISDFTYY